MSDDTTDLAKKYESKLQEFEKWKNELIHELDKSKSVAKINAYWLTGIAAALACYMGFTTWIGVPKRVKELMNDSADKAVKEEIKNQAQVIAQGTNTLKDSAALLDRLQKREEGEIFPYAFYSIKLREQDATVSYDEKNNITTWRSVVLTGSAELALCSIGNTTNTNPLSSPGITGRLYPVDGKSEKGVQVDLLFFGRTHPTESEVPITILQKDGVPGTPRVVKYVAD